MSEGTPEASPGLSIQQQASAEPAAESTTNMIESGAVETPMGDPPKTEEPELLAGKDHDALLKGYLELEKMQGSQKQVDPEAGVQQILESAGIDATEITANYMADGKLTDEQYTSLQKLGFSKAMTNDYLESQKAVAQNGVYAQQAMEREAAKLAGGKEQLDGLLRWASQNMDEGRIKDLDSRLAQPNTYQSALKELMFDYQMAKGTAGNRQEILAGQAMPNVSRGFDSVNEMLAAIRTTQEQGYMDESFKRRMANTPQSIINGVDTKR